MNLRNKAIILLAALVMIFAAGCSQEEEAETVTETTTEQVESTEEAVDETAETTDAVEETTEDAETSEETADEAVTIYATNEDGGYTITIPEDWDGKVSYTLDGASTIFSHITLDTEATEQNPVLLTIAVAAAGEEYDGDVILETEDYTYYMVIPVDLPYEADTDDATQYTELNAQAAEVAATLAIIEDTTVVSEADSSDEETADEETTEETSDDTETTEETEDSEG